MNNAYINKLNFTTQMNEYCLTPEEDAEFMANIDMEALERGVRQSEEEIANGQGIEFEEAMAIIEREVFGEEI